MPPDQPQLGSCDLRACLPSARMPTTHMPVHIDPKVQALYDAGAHFGYGRGRRHPSAVPFIFTTKSRSDIFDLDETHRLLEVAKQFIADTAATGRQVLFVGGKHEVVRAVRDTALRIQQPYVAGRFIGGTLTNFGEIRKRVERLQKLSAERESGEHEKYTKHERLLLEREMIELETRFGGITSLETPPAALVIVDPREEKVAVREAARLGIPIVAIASSDCDFGAIKYPIPANDSAIKSVTLLLEDLAESYRVAYRPLVRNKKPETTEAAE